MLVATNDTRPLTPRLRDQLRGALLIDTRLGLLGGVALVLELAWWISVWLALRHVQPGKTVPLPHGAATIAAVSQVLLVLTPALTAVASLAAALQSRALAFDLTHALTRRRVLALRLVPAITIGWLLDAVAAVGHRLVARHLTVMHPDWGTLAWQVPASLALTFALCALAALLALVIASGPGTIGATSVLFLAVGIGATIVAPRLLAPRSVHLPAFTATTRGVGPSSGITVTARMLPASDDVLARTYYVGDREVSELTLVTAFARLCTAKAGSAATVAACIRSKSLSQTLRYQPASRFGTIEALATLLLALLGLAGLGVLDRRMRRLEL